MSVFAKATKVAAPVTKTKGKKEPARVRFPSYLNLYVAASACVAHYSSIIKTEGEKVRTNMAAQFVKMGMALGGKPDLFVAEGAVNDEVVATARMTLARRDSRSPLTSEETGILTDNELDGCMADHVVDCGVAGGYFINPALFNNPVAMEKFSKALERAKLTEIDGEPILNYQEPREATVVKVVSEDAFDVLFGAAKERNWTEVRTMQAFKVLAVCKIGNDTLMDNTLDTALRIMEDSGVETGRDVTE